MVEPGVSDIAKVFICYARRDRRPCEELRASLAMTEWEVQPYFEVWHDDDVEVGADWPDELRLKLSQADIFVVLLSKWLLQSHFVRDIEFPVISERRSQGDASVIVVPVTRLELGTTPFASIQHALAKPLSEYPHRDEAWHLITSAVLTAAAQRPRQRATPSLTPGDPATEVDGTDTEDTANVIPLRRMRHQAPVGANRDGVDHLEAVMALMRALPLQSDPGWASFQIRVGSAFRSLEVAIVSTQLSPWAHEQALVLRSALDVLCSSTSEPSARSRALQAARQAAVALQATSDS